MHVTAVKSEQHLSEIIASNEQVLIDFWAAWCGPCKAMSPIFDQLAEDNANRVKSVKVNIDDLPTIAQHYGIRSIPSLLLIKNKQVISEHIGAAPKTEVASWLNEH